MAIDLPSFAVGDTDYVAKLNANFSSVENAVNTIEGNAQSRNEKGAADGYAPLGPDQTVPLANLPDLSVYQLRAERGEPLGYATLDSDGKVPAEQLPEAQDLSNFVSKATVGVANGVASLNSSGDVPTTQIPDLSATYTTKAREGAANGVATLDSGGKVPSGQLPDLGAGVYIPTSEKGAANGVATLDSGGKIPTSQLPTTEDGHPYDLISFYPGKPTDSALLLRVKMVREVVFAEGLEESLADAVTAATAETTLTIKKNGASIGSIVFGAAGTTGTFTFGSAVTFDPGDVLTVENQASADATLANISITLTGTR